MKPHDAHLSSISRITEVDGHLVSVIEFRGAVREATARTFQNALDLAGLRSPFLVVDLGDTDYLSSGGLGALLAQHGYQENQSGWLRLLPPSNTVDMILKVAGAEDRLRVVTDLEEAVQDLSTRAA